MTQELSDILWDIPDEDLPKLAEMYKKHKDLYPEVYSVITTGVDWRKKRKEKYLAFMSPNGCWKQDGTFFVLQAHYAFDIFFFSLDDSGRNIYDGIRKTRRLDTGDYKDRLTLLHTIHNKFYPIAMQAFNDKGRTLSLEIPCHRFLISKEEALQFEIECPPELYIKKLDSSHAELVNSVWPHRYTDSVKFVTLLIEMNDGYGLFLKSNDELVAWSLLCMLGQLGLVQTVDAHKRKGYASVVVKHVSKQIALKGHNPFGTVLEKNMASVSMFQKLGFKNSGIAVFTFL